MKVVLDMGGRTVEGVTVLCHGQEQHLVESQGDEKYNLSYQYKCPSAMNKSIHEMNL